MKFFRNPEIIRACIWLAACAAAFTAAGFFVSPVCAALLLGCAACFSAIFLISTSRRYRSIGRLVTLLAEILHGTTAELPHGEREGELAVLSSEIRKLTLSLRDKTELLTREQQRLSDAMADISHQLRTPLTSMELVVSFLSEEGLPAERRAELARELRTLLRHTDRLVVSLLRLARLDAGAALRQEEVSAGALLSLSCEPLLIAAELKDVRLTVSADEFSLTCDTEQTAEALSNIIKNCVEHTQPGGEVRIEATETPLFVQVTVSDNGGGISAADLPHLFERFYRGAYSKGFGIGLSLAKTVMNAQGGTLTAANTDTGAVFTARLPRKN